MQRTRSRNPGSLRVFLQKGIDMTEKHEKSSAAKSAAKHGITFGSALAMVISYTTWKSVGWAIIHGLMSWLYVIYFILRY